MNLTWVFIGGGLGAALRWYLSGFFQSGENFPLATLSINLIGCLLIGIFSVLVLNHPKASLFLITGILGGFTTFSSFGLDAFKLIASEEYKKLFIYLALSNILGIMLVIIAHKITTFLIK
jgi:CrcB protein